MTAVTKLHPADENNAPWFGEQTRTIASATGEDTIHYTFDNIPTPLPVDFPTAEWGEGHLGRGVFLTRDSNGNAILDTADIFSILRAGSFLKPGDWDWTEGDFDGDRDVDTSDIFLILATGQWGDFTPYYPEHDVRPFAWFHQYDPEQSTPAERDAAMAQAVDLLLTRYGV